MQNGQPTRKFSPAKRIAACLGAFALLSFFFILLLPTLFSTSVGKSMLSKMIGNRTDCTLQIADLSLSWFGSQQATGIAGQNTKQQLSFSCQEMTSDSPLWKILLRNDLGLLQLTLPQLQLAKPFQPAAQMKKRSLQSASFAAVPQIELAMPAIDLPITGQITTQQGKIDFNPPGVDPIQFDQIAASLDMRKKEEIALTLNCITSLGNTQGQIALKAAASELKSAFPTFSIQSSITQLPVLGVDQLLATFKPQMNGILYSALGKTIDLQCNLSAAQGNFDLSLNAQSPQITVQAATQTANGMISLKNPATVNFNLTPALFAKLTRLYPALSKMTLTQPGTLQATIAQFSCPISSHREDLLKASFEANISSSSPLLFSLNEQPLSMSTFKFHASSSSIEEKIAVSTSSTLQLGEQAGAIALEGNISQPFAQTRQGKFALNASNLPTDLIGVAAGTTYSLSTLLGPTTNLQGSLDINPKNPKLLLSWQSQFLSLPKCAVALSDPYTLMEPASFTFSFNPTLGKADPIQGVIQNLQIPAGNIKNSQLEATLQTGRIAMGAPLPLNAAALKMSLSIKTLDQIALQISSEPLTASLFGSFNPASSTFSLTRPMLVKYILDTASFPTLATPAVLQLSIDPFTLPINDRSLNQLKLKGQLTCAETTFNTQGKQIALQNTSLPFQWDGRAKTASVQISSQMQNPSGPAGSIQGQIDLSNISTEKEVDLSRATLQGGFDLQNISSAFIDAFIQKTSLSGIVGPTFSSKLKIQSSVDKQNLSLKWTSANLTIDSSFLIDKSAIRLQGATNQIAWTLTPESYKYIDQLLTGPVKGMVPFEIQESSTFNFSLNKLSFPIATKKEVLTLQDRIPDITFDLNPLELSATGSNSLLSFWDLRSKESIRLQNIAFTLNKSAGSGPLTTTFESGIVTQNSPQSMRNGSISLTAKLEGTRDLQGAFDFSKLTSSLALKVQQLPSRALDLIARAKGRTDFPFTTIFGDMINATAHIDLKNFSGPVSLNINTPMTKADIAGTLVNGALLLKDSLFAQVKITPEMSRLLLKEINPLNLSYLYSLAPVTLEMRPDGFYFPIYPFSMEKIAIPDATIELGKIACRNEGNVGITLGLLKAKQDKNGEMSLWFAPIDLSVKKGIVAVDRTEILLANNFDICVWGNVDLVKDYVDMVLGLTAQTLNKAFGIQNLPKDYVLTIPMKGKSDNVQINSGKATAKVALLLAWQNNVGEAIGGSKAGALLGGLMGKIATLPDANAKVPPAKHPFPWEVGKNGKSSHAHGEKKRQFKADEKPLKQILKVIR